MNKVKVFLVAGEASGDRIGANLLGALSQRGIEFEFFGVGGPLLKEAGMKIFFESSKISVMGFCAVIPKIPEIFYRLHQTVKAACNYKPDLVITIDSPGFNFRFVKKLRILNTLNRPMFINYVAPSVWADNPPRDLKLSRLYDHLIVILPFERQYFTDIPCHFVGHPIIERLPQVENKNGFIITVMPGSRLAEIKSHIKILSKTLKLFLSVHSHEKILLHIPTLSHLKLRVEALCSKHLAGIDVIITSDQADQAKLTAQSRLALVKCGTSVMETLWLGIPTIAFYRVSKISALWLKKKLNLQYFTLPNILLNKQVIPEFIQEAFTAENLCSQMLKGITFPAKEMKIVWEMLGAAEKTTPSQKAANIIIEALVATGITVQQNLR